MVEQENYSACGDYGYTPIEKFSLVSCPVSTYRVSRISLYSNHRYVSTSNNNYLSISYCVELCSIIYSLDGGPLRGALLVI